MRHFLAPIQSLLCVLPAFAAPDAKPDPDITLNEKYEETSGDDSVKIIFTDASTAVVEMNGRRGSAKYVITESPSKEVTITLDKTDPSASSPVEFHLSIPGAGILGSDRGVVFSTAAAKDKAKAVQADLKRLSQSKQIGLACRLYAGDNHGKYPKQLADLLPTYIPPDLFAPLTMQKIFDRIEYLGAGTGDTSPPGTLLLRWKEPTFDGKRIVVYLDGSGKIVPADK